MSTHEDIKEETTVQTVFLDIDLNPITCDDNPAHFDGLLLEVAAFCQRTGKFLPLLEQGVSIPAGTAPSSTLQLPSLSSRVGWPARACIVLRTRALPLTYACPTTTHACSPLIRLRSSL